MPCDFICLDIQLTPIQIAFHWGKVEKTAHSTGEIRNDIRVNRVKTIHNELAHLGGGEKLAVLNLLLCAGVFIVAVKIRILQTMQSTISGIGIVDIFACNPRGLRKLIVNQI